jgi:hypothetical protein
MLVIMYIPDKQPLFLDRINTLLLPLLPVRCFNSLLSFCRTRRETDRSARNRDSGTAGHKRLRVINIGEGRVGSPLSLAVGALLPLRLFVMKLAIIVSGLRLCSTTSIYYHQ